MPNQPKKRVTFARNISQNKQRRGDPFYHSAAWKALRTAKRTQSPLCETCEAAGLTVAMHAVDHILPRSQRPDLELEIDNLQSLCLSCHSRKTAFETGLGTY